MSCVFCSLIAAGSAHWVSRGPVASAFAPLDPIAPGHTLVVPTAHFEGVFDVPSAVLAETMGLVQVVSLAMRSALGAGGVNLLSASGPGSEQSVPHLHFHIVPRWADDGLSTWPPERSRHEVGSDPIEALARALR